MKINELIEESASKPVGRLEVDRLAYDSRDIRPGTLFFCLAGAKTDGHLFVGEAERLGAVALVSERDLPAHIPVVRVADTRHALAVAAKRFYGSPSDRLVMIGVTGTNGKTTTTYIIKSILDKAGCRTGLIGTNAVMIGEEEREATMTTPDPVELNRLLAEMEGRGVTHVVMEVSAHALALNKTDGIVYDVAAFTNFTRDHLDFFGDMETYKRAKARLFTEGLSKYAVLNVDDAVGFELYNLTTLPKMTYGCNNPSDVFAVELSLSEYGIEFVINILDDIQHIKFALPGRFNMYNVLCAAAVCRTLNVPVKTIAKGVKALKKVAGRFNVINAAKASIIIDYAHTDDGLRNILGSVREFTRGRVITVFGCGGERDREKRPLMGRAASELSDVTIVTSDNPRTEDPAVIIDEIVSGIEKGRRPLYQVPDRRRAIMLALELAEEGDIVVVAGKGAEKYQDVMGVKQPYNDEQFIQELVKENRIS
ncbi:MAG: UDP-N-acetylmuramoyl-L-alanyl-D-glutamate--2,6-diaminopimelate ligase [Clostridiales bacterium]|jgi:UDP-N-acetylmuramyl-tripeptide synthetase|nr:UDP-N-acetylmuramoyl-L-alanyl-D-glutamate--2,6-diaminopimelate ligase [Clostridiales bacterium]